MGQQIGNAMSVNVIEQILAGALQAAGLIRTSSMKDSQVDLTRWQEGRGLQQIIPQSRKINKTPAKSADLEWKSKPRTWFILSATSTAGRRLLLDSGASYHMVSEHDLS